MRKSSSDYIQSKIMADEIKTNAAEASTHDAQLLAENIAAGEEKAPKVDFEADYAAAQEMSVSEVAKTPEGAKLAEAAVAPKYEITKPEKTETVAVETGNREDFMDMANEITSGNEAITSVDDDLVKRALEMGKPGK
jgi:phage antirepressor YoqD-like protein